MIDKAITNINRSLVLSFKNGDNDLTRHSFDKYYMSLVEVKDSNALTDSKLFFDQTAKKRRRSI